MTTKREIKLPANFLMAIDRVHTTATNLFNSMDEKALQLAGSKKAPVKVATSSPSKLKK